MEYALPMLQKTECQQNPETRLLAKLKSRRNLLHFRAKRVLAHKSLSDAPQASLRRLLQVWSETMFSGVYAGTRRNPATRAPLHRVIPGNRRAMERTEWQQLKINRKRKRRRYRVCRLLLHQINLRQLGIGGQNYDTYLTGETCSNK